MTSGIYKISFGSSKCYVGSSVNLTKRKQDHKSRLKHETSNCVGLQRAFNKYGIDAFTFEVIEYCSIEKLRIREMHHILEYNSVNDGYNIALDTSIPMLGRKHSEKTKKLMSLNSKRLKTNLGRKFSKEHLQRMSDSMMGKNAGIPRNVGGDNPQAKITADEALEIKRLKGIISQLNIGKMFGISQTQVWRIHNGLKWNHIKNDD